MYHELRFHISSRRPLGEPQPDGVHGRGDEGVRGDVNDLGSLRGGAQLVVGDDGAQTRLDLHLPEPHG